MLIVCEASEANYDSLQPLTSRRFWQKRVDIVRWQERIFKFPQVIQVSVSGGISQIELTFAICFKEVDSWANGFTSSGLAPPALRLCRIGGFGFEPGFLVLTCRPEHQGLLRRGKEP